jgi:hypothetical protein
MSVKYRFLFNFSVTRTGGGLKRLSEYANWFNQKGGAWFIIHQSCISLAEEFPNNSYYVVKQSQIQRVFNDCNYLPNIIKDIKKPDLYYSYGIPVYSKIGNVNWFHMSNVLPLNSMKMGLSFFDRYVKVPMLRSKILKNYINADVISAESNNSLNMINSRIDKKMVLSVNGSDDELKFMECAQPIEKDNIAVIVGTQKYKELLDSYIIFESLKEKNSLLKLYVIGDKGAIPSQLVKNESVILMGVLEQSEVINCLKRARFYISTTRIENSFNAASEGVFLSDESYISDIGPHQELLEDEVFQRVTFPLLSNNVLHAKRINLLGKNIKPWNDVIIEMIDNV